MRKYQQAKMQSAITIIIPTHNRPRQLERLLNYFKKFNIPIIVGDSTAKPFTKLKQFKSVRYYHFPNYSYSKKLPLIYAKVKSKYVLFCADDDFIIPMSILKCVDFLNKHPDYSSAHGHYVFFEPKNDNLKVYPFYLASADLDVNSDIPSGRLVQMMSNYMQLLYAVTKTEDIKEAFKLLAKNPKIKNDNLVELFQTIILCINGKSKTLPILYGAREVTPGSARTHTEELDAFFRKPAYLSEYQSWFSAISNHLSKKEKISKKQAQEIVNEAIKLYLKNSLLYLPFLKVSFIVVQRLMNKYSFGFAKKIFNIVYKSQSNENLKKHAFSKKINQKEFKKIQQYIDRYALN